jgi:predicted nucleotidyltransferase
MPAINDERLLDRLSTELSKVPGVRAIILGGSRARGDAGANSDYDIGLYYEHGDPLDIASLERAVAMLDDAGPTASVTAIGGWGPWINGGGWLTVGGTRVDLIGILIAFARPFAIAAKAGSSVITNPGIPTRSSPRSTWERSPIAGPCLTQPA